MAIYGPRFGSPFVMRSLKALPRRIAEESGTNNISIEDLVLWASEGDAAVAALRDANQRPHTRLPGDYSVPFNTPIPNNVSVRALARFLGSRARVHLLAGKSAAALEDLEGVLVIMRAVDVAPRTLVSAMIRTAIGGLYVEVERDGLTESLWREPELRFLADRLSEINLIAPVQNSLREGELAGVSRVFDDLAGPKNSPRRKSALQVVGATQLTPNGVLIRASPRSWIRRNQTLHAGLMMAFIESMDGEKRRYYPKTNELASEIGVYLGAWKPRAE